jgi:hypothetical protein
MARAGDVASGLRYNPDTRTYIVSDGSGRFVIDTRTRRPRSTGGGCTTRRHPARTPGRPWCGTAAPALSAQGARPSSRQTAHGAASSR